TGFDPFVGRKLFSFARNAGLTNIDVQVECYHLIAGEADPHILQQWELKLEIARPQLARVHGGEREAEEQSRAFLEYLRRPDSLTYSTVFTVAGEKGLWVDLRLAELCAISWGFLGKYSKKCGRNGPRLKWANNLILIAESVWLGCVDD